MTALVPMSQEELGKVLATICPMTLPLPKVVHFTLTRGEALWLINAGLSEARRNPQ